MNFHEFQVTQQQLEKRLMTPIQRRFSVHMLTLCVFLKCILLRDSGYSGDFGFIINK